MPERVGSPGARELRVRGSPQGADQRALLAHVRASRKGALEETAPTLRPSTHPRTVSVWTRSSISQISS